MCLAWRKTFKTVLWSVLKVFALFVKKKFHLKFLKLFSFLFFCRWRFSRDSFERKPSEVRLRNGMASTYSTISSFLTKVTLALTFNFSKVFIFRVFCSCSKYSNFYSRENGKISYIALYFLLKLKLVSF